MRSYDDPDPIILSVSEEEEISIADAARAVHREYHPIIPHCIVTFVLYFIFSGAMNCQQELVFDTSKSDGQFKKTANNA